MEKSITQEEPLLSFSSEAPAAAAADMDVDESLPGAWRPVARVSEDEVDGQLDARDSDTEPDGPGMPTNDGGEEEGDEEGEELEREEMSAQLAWVHEEDSRDAFDSILPGRGPMAFCNGDTGANPLDVASVSAHNAAETWQYEAVSGGHKHPLDMEDVGELEQVEELEEDDDASRKRKLSASDQEPPTKRLRQEAVNVVPEPLQLSMVEAFFLVYAVDSLVITNAAGVR